MRILCVVQRYNPAIGGAEKIAETFMDYLSQRHYVEVFTTDAETLDGFWSESGKQTSDSKIKPYKIRRFKTIIPNTSKNQQSKSSLPIFSPGPFCPEMWNELLNLNDSYDIIVAVGFPYNHIIPAILCSKKNQIPIIVIPFLHLEFPEYYFTGLRIGLLSASDAIVVNTLAEKNYVEKLGISAKKIHIIPPGLKIETEESKYDIKKKLGLDSDSLVVLFAGTKSFAKGAITLVEAIKELRRKSENIELVLIGKSMTDYNEYTKKHKIQKFDGIHDLDLVNDAEKANIFKHCDIFALPSKSESLGLVYLEAWNNKKPVIGCKIAAIQNVVDDGKNGILVKFNDVDELSLAVKQLQDENLRYKLGNNGFQKLVKEYDFCKQAEKFEKLCVSLISN